MTLKRPIFPWVWTGLVALGAVAGAVFLDGGDSFGWERASSVLLPTFLSFLGAVIASREPGNLIAWLLMLLGAGLLIAGVAETYVNPTAGPPPNLDFWDYLFIWLGIPAGLVAVHSLILILFLFPTGRLISRMWSWAIWLPALFFLLIVSMAAFSETVGTLFGVGEDDGWVIDNPIGFIPVALLEAVTNVWSILTLVVLPVGGVVAMVVRYRRSTVTIRTQIKWVVYGSVVAVVSFPLGVEVFYSSPIWSDVFVLVAFGAIPIAITAAITRYRLFDIDRLISRTVSYGAIVALLGLVFAAGVVWVPTAFGLEDSPLLVAGTTLLVAALFNPLRMRMQDLVDRRFNRSRYQARRVEERFAVELQNASSRTELADVWLDTVDEVLSPQASGVWLRTNDHP